MWFRKLLSVILIIILVPLIIINVLVYSLKTTLLNPLYLESNLVQNHVYENIINTALPLVANSLTQEGQVDKEVNIDDLVFIVQKSISPIWLEDQFNTIFTQFNNYLIGKSNNINIVINLKDLKTSLTDGFSQFTQEGIKNLPTCTDEQMTKLDENNRQLDCLPEGFSKDEITKSTKEMFSSGKSDNMFSQFPDEYNLGDLLMQSQGPTLQTARTFYGYLKLGLLLLTIINLIILTLIGLLIWKPPSSLIKWVSSAIIIPSILLLIPSAFGYLASNIVSPNFGFNLPGEFNTIISTLIINLIRPLDIKIIIISGSGVLLAIIGYTIAHFLRPFKKASLEDKSGLASATGKPLATPVERPSSANKRAN